MPGSALNVYRDLREIRFLGPCGGLELTEWNTAFGSRPDETNERDGKGREEMSFAVGWEVWDRRLNDPSIDSRVLDCFETMTLSKIKIPGVELVRIALSLRSATAASVGWCTCLTGYKFAQFVAVHHYGVETAALRKALSWLDSVFGSTEVTNGEQGYVSVALEWYAFKSRVVSMVELFLDEECTRQVSLYPRELARGVLVYEKVPGSKPRCYRSAATGALLSN
jgi:hypothetical protein